MSDGWMVKDSPPCHPALWLKWYKLIGHIYTGHWVRTEQARTEHYLLATIIYNRNTNRTNDQNIKSFYIPKKPTAFSFLDIEVFSL